MTALLLKLFIKDHTNPDSPAVRAAIGKLAGTVGIVCNILLFAFKLLIGLISGSVAIIADAANNLSDTSSSAITLLAFRLSQKPADKDHPYGHARYEYLAGLAVAFLILLIGAQLVVTSVERIVDPAEVSVSRLTLAILIASIAMKLWMSLFFRSLSSLIRSTVLRATSVDARNDVLITSAVLVGCLIHNFFRINIDAYIGLAVAAFILYTGIGIAKDTISPLLGGPADKELVERLSALILSHEKILGFHDLLIHDYGPGRCFASVHAELSADDDPLLCHDILDAIERAAKEQLNVHLVIHYDPVDTHDPLQHELKDAVEAIVHSIDAQFSIHDFRTVRSGDHVKLVFDLTVPYAVKQTQSEIKRQLDAALLANNIPYETVIQLDKHA